MQVATAESAASWTGFFRDLKAQGLDQVYLVTRNAHQGIQTAVGACLPQASWQRCRIHFAQNLLIDGADNPSGRHCRRCFRRSSSNPTLTTYATRPGMSSSSASRNSPMWPTTWRNPKTTCWRLRMCRKRCGRRCGQTTPPKGSTGRSDAAPTSLGSFQPRCRRQAGRGGTRRAERVRRIQQKRYMSLTSLEQTETMMTATVIDAGDSTQEAA